MQIIADPRQANGEAILDFVRERGAVHPREVDAHFSHGRVTNWFGGSSNASTQLLDHMHYRGLLRVARRDGGTRVYVAREAALAEMPLGPLEAKALAAIADGRVGGCDRAQIRAAAGRQPGKFGESPASMGHRNGRRNAKRHWPAPSSVFRTHASTASIGIGLRRKGRSPCDGGWTTRCAC